MPFRRHQLRLLLLLLAFAAGALSFSAQAASAQTPMSAKVMSANGFGDRENSYSWAMSWFRGKLYVGTSRNTMCVENATVEFFYPNISYYQTEASEGVTCPFDRYDMDLRAEIWQYTPDTGKWLRVYQAPADVPNAREPGKFVARSIAFRGMYVFKGQLYVMPMTAGEYIPETRDINRPRILRTKDGRNFKAFSTAPYKLRTAFGDQVAVGFRSMGEYKGKVYVHAMANLTGDGVLMRVDDPASGHPRFTQITPKGMQIFDFEMFNNQIYVGTATKTAGYGVYRTEARNGSKSKFYPVVTNSMGLGTRMTSVVAMSSFQDRLYVTASGWNLGSILSDSEVIRVNKQDQTDLVVGDARKYRGRWKRPLSGLQAGFGNMFNAHFWRVTQFGNGLVLGTNDTSRYYKDLPLVGSVVGQEAGFDVWATCDGRFWWPLTRHAFDTSTFNFGLRTFAVSERGRLFMGSANHAEGTWVLRGGIARLCNKRVVPGDVSPHGKAAAAPVAAPGAPASPTRLIADTATAGQTVLSWDASDRARRYRVYRADITTTRVAVPTAERRTGLEVPEVPVGRGPAREADIETAGAWQPIAETTSPAFNDRGAPAKARYKVVAVDARGRESGTSNEVHLPAQIPTPTFADAQSAVRAGDGRAQAASANRLQRARLAVRAGRRAAALRELDAIRLPADSDAADTLLRLERHVRYGR